MLNAQRFVTGEKNKFILAQSLVLKTFVCDKRSISRKSDIRMHARNHGQRIFVLWITNRSIRGIQKFFQEQYNLISWKNMFDYETSEWHRSELLARILALLKIVKLNLLFICRLGQTVCWRSFSRETNAGVCTNRIPKTLSASLSSKTPSVHGLRWLWPRR